MDMGTAANDMRLRRPEVQRAYRDAAARTGLEIASLALAELNSVPLKSDPRAARGWPTASTCARPWACRSCSWHSSAKGELDMKRTDEIDHVVEVLKEIAPKAEKTA